MKDQTTNSEHIPVLLDEVIELLSPREGETYLDLTAGYGGHASAVLEITKGYAVLVDRDINAVKYLQKTLDVPNVAIKHADFLSASKKLADSEKRFDLILADLGVSSPHLNMASRGFSVKNDGPLDMRMDQSQELTAKDIVNECDVNELADTIWHYGEDPKSRSIARAIVEARPISSTAELAEIVQKTIGKHGKTHPATKTFQALRIAVNSELEQLEKALPIWLKLLGSNGRLAVISFHSLEDRIVKQFFQQHGGNTYDAQLKQLTKTPITASQEEIAFNPRARSAKLRAVAKIKI